MATTIVTRFTGKCADCGSEIPAGAQARYYGRGKLYGLTCHAQQPANRKERRAQNKAAATRAIADIPSQAERAKTQYAGWKRDGRFFLSTFALESIGMTLAHNLCMSLYRIPPQPTPEPAQSASDAPLQSVAASETYTHICSDNSAAGKRACNPLGCEIAEQARHMVEEIARIRMEKPGKPKTARNRRDKWGNALTYPDCLPAIPTRKSDPKTGHSALFPWGKAVAGWGPEAKAAVEAWEARPAVTWDDPAYGNPTITISPQSVAA